jgi:hypothetical protein
MRSRQEEDKATAAAAGRSAGVQDGYLPLAEQAVEGVGVKQRLVEVASPDSRPSPRAAGSQ